MLIALLVFSPVLIWNSQHDWASFKFQFIRAGADHGISARTVGDFLGLQLALVGPILFPVALCGLGDAGMARLSAAAIRRCDSASRPARWCRSPISCGSR